MKEVTQREVESALQRLEAVAQAPRAIAIGPEPRGRLRQAIERVRAQLLGEADAVLTIALAGCTGSGKSTLINALAGTPIADVSDRRPTTMQTKVYHHEDIAAGGLPKELAGRSTFIAHDRPELRQKVIVDTPDLDTYYTQNREATRALLKAAGLVIYVFSPERYVEERAWSVIREEQRFSACLAVLNKADTVEPEALERIAEEIRQRFAEMGKPDIAILRICAACHVPGPNGQPARPARGVVDQFAALRAFIEHELRAGDIARMIRQQRLRVVDHLRAVVDEVAPPDAGAALDAVSRTAAERAAAAADRLAMEMQERLLAVDADLMPLVVVRKHQRFWGPFRTWLAVTDFLRYGLPRLIRQLRVFSSEEPGSAIERMLATGKAGVADDVVRGEAQQIQSLLFARGLPVEKWRDTTAGADGQTLLREAARQIGARFEALAAAAYGRHTIFIWLISLLGAAIPAGLVVLALYNLVRQLLENRPAGFEALWSFLALVLFLYLLLHMLTAIVLPGRSPFSRHGVAGQTLQDVVRQMVAGWVGEYRAQVQADLNDLREPLALLETAAEGVVVRQRVVVARPAAEPPATGEGVATTAGAPGGADAAQGAPPAAHERTAPEAQPTPLPVQEMQPPAQEAQPAEEPQAEAPLSAAELLRRSIREQAGRNARNGDAGKGK